MKDREMDELVRIIAEVLAAIKGLTVEQYYWRLLCREFLRNPGPSILPGFGDVDRHGGRGLGQPPVHPAALDRLR